MERGGEEGGGARKQVDARALEGAGRPIVFLSGHGAHAAAVSPDARVAFRGSRMSEPVGDDERGEPSRGAPSSDVAGDPGNGVAGRDGGGARTEDGETRARWAAAAAE